MVTGPSSSPSMLVGLEVLNSGGYEQFYLLGYNTV
jgi:hypothetical protein